MNTPGSRKWSARRMRSPRSAPLVNGEDGSIESTPLERLVRLGLGQQPCLHHRGSECDQRQPEEFRARVAAVDRPVSPLDANLGEAPALELAGQAPTVVALETGGGHEAEQRLDHLP